LVLLVEDDSVLARSLARALARYCTVEHAPTNIHAIEMLATRDYVAILSDWDLGDGIGIAALEHSVHRLPLARRVLYTAHARDEIEPQLPPGLVHALFEKPCEPIELARALGVA
jgi:DNA-binding NtrC family response regulator